MDYSYGFSKEEIKQKSQYKDDNTQKMLNEPLKATSESDKADEDFLNILVGMIIDGKIDLYKPDTLINHEVYDKLSEEKQGKADLEAVNMLSAIRNIKDLYDQDYQDTFQMENMVHRLRVSKERLEEEGGDLFVI